VSLNWDLSAIADHEAVCFVTALADDQNHGIVKGDRILNPVTNALIWATIQVDLPGITRLNAPEFFARLRFTEQLDGPMLIRAEVEGQRPKGFAAFITPEEVIAHIGLTANVSPLPRTKWLRKFSRDLDRSVGVIETMFREQEAAAV
jgi:hypothetical protein